MLRYLIKDYMNMTRDEKLAELVEHWKSPTIKESTYEAGVHDARQECSEQLAAVLLFQAPRCESTYRLKQSETLQCVKDKGHEGDHRWSVFDPE
jgi:hypothetical protein